MNTNIGKELYDVLDALVALRIELNCDPCTPGEVLVLSAARARAACEALDAADASIREIVAHLGGGNPGLLPRH
jgi:hypothetical protein